MQATIIFSSLRDDGCWYVDFFTLKSWINSDQYNHFVLNDTVF